MGTVGGDVEEWRRPERERERATERVSRDGVEICDLWLGIGGAQLAAGRRGTAASWAGWARLQGEAEA